jgi:hypothetical protein
MSFSTRQLLPFLGASTFILIPTLASAAPTKPPVKKPASSTARAKSQAARPSVAAPSLTLGNWDYEFEEDELEDRWSWRGQITNGGNGEGRIVFDWKDTKNYNLLQIISAGTTRKLSVWQIQNGIPINKGQINQSSGKEITLQRVGQNIRVLVNGEQLLSTPLPTKGSQFGVAATGKFSLDSGGVQPTAPVEMRDDFMRAEGPEDKEVPGEWLTEGEWKTSGTLGPKSDVSLNPNPFVFRAGGNSSPKGIESVAKAGKWFWSDYAVSVSLRATQTDENTPLIASIGAYLQSNGNILRSEIDFKEGVARLLSGNKVLAQSAPFDVGIGQWHRVRFEPGPGVARLIVDGIERVKAPSKLAQGQFTLAATTGGGNYVDYDDVRVAEGGKGDFFQGESALPQRFAKDRLMQYWANEARSWKRAESGVWWHIGDFFGDSTISLPIPKLEIGQGVGLVRGQSNTAAYTADNSRITLTRTQNGYLIEVNGYGNYKFSKTLSPAEVEGKNLTVALKQQTKSTLFDRQISLDDKVIRVDSLTSSGNKIGILPLQNSSPLPPPATKPLTIYSTTYGREGQTVIGVNLTPVTEEIRRQAALPDATGVIIDHVDEESPALKAGILPGDVVRAVNDSKVVDVNTMRSAIGAVRPGTRIKIDVLRAQPEKSGLDWGNCIARTPNSMDYSFTTAPVDWRATRGKWEISERWTCSPQWSFFAGTDDIVPTLWSRYATTGDWTLEAYLATPMDQARGERSPTDINVTVGGDGVNLASGYSFMFAAHGRSENQIRRGDNIAFKKPFEMPAGVGDTHQDWFYVRIEKRTIDGKNQFKWIVNGREIASYTDQKPLADGGRIAFWTKNGGLSIARVRLWHSGIKNIDTPFMPRVVNANAVQNDLGIWSPRGQGRETSANIQLISDAAKPVTTPATTEKTLKFTNPQSGGDWTVYVTREPFSAQKLGILEWEYKITSEARVNLYAKVEGIWREITFAGLGVPSDGANNLGAVPNFINDGTWQRARFDLQAGLKRQGINSSQIDALAFAAPNIDYLQAGLGGNKQGASWFLRNFRARQD